MQEVTVTGRDNIIVQIEGDNNIVGGRPYLRLTRYPNRRRSISDEAISLTAYARSVPMLGREAEVADLRGWTSNDKPISVRVMTGAGGRGKTRLALELCDALGNEGWDAGFVTDSELERFIKKQNASIWGWRRPTLAVIDYAAARCGLLNKWLVELADNAGNPENPLRVLLLERDATPGAGWWETAFGRGSGDALAIARLLDPPEPVPLAEITSAKYQFEILNFVLEGLGSTTRAPEPKLDPGFYRRLDTLSWGGDPLFLMVAAVAASDGGLGSLLTLNRTELAFSLADREISRIEKIADGRNISREFLTHIAALATLCQGLRSEDLLQLIDDEKVAQYRHSGGDAPEISAALFDGTGMSGDGVRPIQPDLIGEAVILRAFARLSPLSKKAPVECFLRAVHRAPTGPLSMVIRAAQDFSDDGYVEPIEWLKYLVQDSATELPLLFAIANQLPKQSVALREFVAEVNAKILEVLRGFPDTQAAQNLPLIAIALNSFSSSLNELGRRDEALTASREATAIYRDLSQRNPALFRLNLARSLNNQSNRLSGVGRREEALAVAQEAIEIYRELEPLRPDDFRAAIAGLLNNLSIRFAELGQHLEALAKAQEATDIFRELEKERTIWPDESLALSLNNLSNRLAGVGRHEEAAAASQGATDIYRKLALEQPDGFRPDLALSLNNLGGHLSDAGRYDEALAPMEEAVAIRRTLAEARPAAFLPDLATSLSNLGNRLSEATRLEEALTVSREAIAIYRQIADAWPDRFLPELEKTLSNLSNHLAAQGRYEDALRPSEEATEICRRLALTRPGVFRPDLVDLLNNLSARLGQLGRHEEAFKSGAEAIQICRELALERPDFFSPKLANLLNNCGAFLFELGQQEEAVRYAEESTQIYEQLASTTAAFSADLAMSLNNLANIFGKLKKNDEALAASHKATVLYRELDRQHPQKFRSDLAMSLLTTSDRLGEKSCHAEALVAARESVAIRRELAKALPRTFGPDLAASLNNLGNRLDQLEQNEEALSAAREAISILAPHFSVYPFRFSIWMQTIIRSYLTRCDKMKMEPDATLLEPIIEGLRPFLENNIES